MAWPFFIIDAIVGKDSSKCTVETQYQYWHAMGLGPVSSVWPKRLSRILLEVYRENDYDRLTWNFKLLGPSAAGNLWECSLHVKSRV